VFGVGAQLAYSVASPQYHSGYPDHRFSDVDHLFGFGAFTSYYVTVVPNFYFKPMLEMNLMFSGGTHFELAFVPAFQYSA